MWGGVRGCDVVWVRVTGFQYAGRSLERVLSSQGEKCAGGARAQKKGTIEKVSRHTKVNI